MFLFVFTASHTGKNRPQKETVSWQDAIVSSLSQSEKVVLIGEKHSVEQERDSRYNWLKPFTSIRYGSGS